MKYDYLVVGAGLFGSVFANQATKIGKKCLVIEKRSHIGGNIYTERREGIDVHRYGAHIFHTDNKEIWDFVNGFCRFNNFINSPIANYCGEIYNLPFNMNTFARMFGVATPQEARAVLEKQRSEIKGKPKNLEEQAIGLVGRDLYDKLVKGYTEKQWGRDCKDLPAFIIKRLPVRFTYNNNYFNDRYQGIPEKGYTYLIEKLLEGIEVKLNENFLEKKEEYLKICDRVVYTGAIDEYFSYCLGKLEYRSLKFETETLDIPDYQGNAVVNFTDRKTPYTRIIEHKHFNFKETERTIITREYPTDWKEGLEPYYPVNDEINTHLYSEYKNLSKKEKRIIFGGRLGLYKYFDMDDVIVKALELFREEKEGK